MAAPFLIRAVAELLDDVPGRGKTLLDVSCKEGDMLRSLHGRGFVLRGTNFEAVDPAAPDVPHAPDGMPIPIDAGVDLRDRLPYADASFDVVLCVEVIEHVSDHQAALGELARVVKPGGVLVLTTPNVMRLNSRLHFLLSGYHKTKRRFIRFDTPLDQAYRFHNYPIDLPILYYLCRRNGLEVERLGHAKVKAYSRFLYAVLGLPVLAYTWYTLRLREKDAHQQRENRKLLHWLCHPRLLMEDNLAIRFRKVGPA